MDMSLLGLEVDGALANPIVARAVLIWCACLFPPSLFLAFRFARAYLTAPKPARYAKSLAFVVGLLILFPVSPLAEFLIVNRLYKLENPAITSVGLWGGPPWWPALVTLAAAASVGWLLAWRQACRVASNAV